MVIVQHQLSRRDQMGQALGRRPWLALEVALGALIVFGNFLMPSAVLAVMGSASAWLRRKSWLDLGLRRPASWPRTLALGTGLGLASAAFSLWVARPVIAALTGQVQDFSSFEPIRGNLQMLLVWLGISWLIGAFLEELAFRGYWLNRLLDLFGTGWAGLAVAVLVNATAFGVMHAYQGLGGILNTAVDASVFALIYLAARRNLWVVMLVHGIGNSVGFLAFYFNWFGLLK
jgi:membrane protease YdiL (CAAX protease family)